MRSLIVSLVTLWASAAALTPKDPPFGQLSVKGANLVDASGTPVQLRGVSLFWSQWMGQFYTADVVKTLKCTWNANLVRAAMAVDQGGYLTNKAAELAKVRAVVEAAIESGIYVIVDWHIHEAQSTQAEAIAFFKQIATDYGKYPHVIYELWNEPLQVDWSSVLVPYHTAVLAAIRAVDPDNVAVLGTPSWSGASGIQAANSAPLTGQTNIMYTLHFYSGSHKDWERSVLSSVTIPIFVTEYGISEADGGSNGQIYTDETNKWYDLLAQKKISYAVWALDDKSESSALLVPGTLSTQIGDDSKLSAGGKFIKAHLTAKNPAASCDGSAPAPAPVPAPEPAPEPAPSPVLSPPSSGGSVSVSAKFSQSWNGGGIADITVTNNGDANICGATLKLDNSASSSFKSFWNLESSGANFATPSYVNLAKGASFTAGADVAGDLPSFSVVSTKSC